MRKDLKKILIYGIKEELNTFLNTSQEKGFIEFIKLKKAKLATPIISDFISAIKILKKQPAQINQEDEIDAKILVKKIFYCYFIILFINL